MDKNKSRTFVIVLDGNSILRKKQKGSAAEQYDNLRCTADQLLTLLSSENRIIVTLSVSKEEAEKIKEGQRIDLLGSDNDEIMASMLVKRKI